MGCPARKRFVIRGLWQEGMGRCMNCCCSEEEPYLRLDDASSHIFRGKRMLSSDEAVLNDAMRYSRSIPRIQCYTTGQSPQFHMLLTTTPS